MKHLLIIESYKLSGKRIKTHLEYYLPLKVKIYTDVFRVPEIEENDFDLILADIDTLPAIEHKNCNTRTLYYSFDKEKCHDPMSENLEISSRTIQLKSLDHQSNFAEIDEFLSNYLSFSA